MKAKIVIATLLGLSGLLTYPAEARNTNAPRARVVAVAPLVISSEEAYVLQWMREEEKLARDVYQQLYGQWKYPELLRIASSEQRHFDALGARLVQYQLTDPALSTQGVFSKLELQDLYWQMITQGSQSYLEALRVGATIEDIDIADLLVAIDGTNNPDLKRTYTSLLEGSKNHLRAFVGLMRIQGGDYTPSYIDPVLFEAIVGN